MLTRRQFLRSGVVVGTVGFSGCSGLVGSSDTPTPANKDTDGDGVINSEDYAPRDASVQRAEQVQEVESETAQRTPTETTPSTDSPTLTDSPTPQSTPPQTRILASFETGWNDFDVLVGDGVSYNQGEDANAERTREEAYTGDWSIKLECSKNGNNGDVAVRRTDINVDGWDTLKVGCKLVVGNTYGNTFIQLYNGNDDRIENYVVRDEQDQGVWEQPSFDITSLSTLRIDLIAASGAAAPQEILVDHITLGRQLG